MLHKPLLILSLTAGLTWPFSVGAFVPTGSFLPHATMRITQVPLILVQDEGSDSDPADDADMADEDMPEDALGISDEETDDIAADLSSGTRFCGSTMDPRYKADCLADQYKAAASAMPAKGGYRDARKALLDAAAKLHALAEANADASTPPAKVRTAKGRPTAP